MNMIKEEWRDIPNYEGLYQVSNKGQVKSLEKVVIRKDGRKNTYPERILKQSKNNMGYLYVDLFKNNKSKKFLVHRLVALAFIPNDNPTDKNEINHLDENPSNNHVSNICWCNRYENNNYGTRNERVSKTLKGKFKDKENHPMFGKHRTEETKQKISKAISIPIIQLDLQNNFIRDWDSATTASTELKISRQHISNCCKGKRNKCGGYKWVYKSNYIPTYTQLELNFEAA